jgi:pimeloyl-ACP methyl ester carboxylesterase
MHGVLVGPVAPTVEARKGIGAPTLVLGHRYDLIHPFDDANNLLRQLPNATFVAARSPLELRLRPGRLTGEIGLFLDQVAESANTTPPVASTAGPNAHAG